jgi:adenosine deaminase
MKRRRRARACDEHHSWSANRGSVHLQVNVSGPAEAGHYLVMRFLHPFLRRASLAILTICAFATIGAAPLTRPTSVETATARKFSVIRRDPLQLRAFLREMPKGGDLHNHLSGAIYAESYLRWAADDQLCVSTTTMSIVGCTGTPGEMLASDVLQNAAIYNQTIDAMSMRHWNTALNGHDHFFATFGKFGPVSSKTGEMLAEVTARAAAEHVSYLELMLTPDGTPARLGRSIGWDPGLATLRERLLTAGLRETVITQVRQRLDSAESRQRELLHCGSAAADPGCGVIVRYIAQAHRSAPREVVFAEMLAWFELAEAEPRIVSLNLVQPEDDPNAVRDFTLQMTMLDFLRRHYPRVPITLHAGELAEGLVPPEALRFHVRQSIEVGHATRIGHGTSIMNEDRPFELLRELVARDVLVEVALSSNEQILGGKGKQHPLAWLLKYRVPVAIVTDDMGVSRSSHTNEFAKAVEDHGLDYGVLKRMVRNSIDFAFVEAPTKAKLKADLEAALAMFERRQAAPTMLKRTGGTGM